MSHFSVLVVTPDGSEKSLTKALAPFHEFECTGHADEFVREVDMTDEARAEYEKATAPRLRSPVGILRSPYDDEFYREPTADEAAKIGPIAGTGGNGTISWTAKDWKDGRGYRTKVRFVPAGWTEVELPVSQVESFRDWAAGWYGSEVLLADHAPDLAETHKYGWIAVDRAGEVAQIVKRTNPDKKWDWWQVGGRYRGKFLGADRSRVADIPWRELRAKSEAEAAARWDRLSGIAAGRPVPNINAIKRLEGKAWREARDAYWANPVIKDFGAAGMHLADEWADALLTRDEALAKARKEALTAFAILKDGQWLERGEMGWWGCVHGEKDEADWRDELSAVLADCDPDHWVTTVDCHI